MVLVLQNGIEGYIAMNRIQTFLRFSEIEERVRLFMKKKLICDRKLVLIQIHLLN